MTTNSLFELLISHLWQVTILSVVVGWMTKSLLKNQPFWSFQLWLLVMVKSITPPIWASHCGVFSWFFHQLSATTAGMVQWCLGPSITTDRVALSLVVLWLVGGITKLVFTLAKWSRIQRRILSVAVSAPEVETCFRRLCVKLGVRRRARLVLTEETIGPVVIGVWSPMVVLPAKLLGGKRIEELEPMLAHELLHVKRGDTWLALLETVVRCVWWFHPEMRRAADSMSQAAELCCDHDVLSQLTYPPRRYADSLIQVLELRCRLQPLVGQPGIRRKQVTRARLERIMAGEHSKPKLAKRLVFMLLAVLLVLPGRSV